MRARLNVELVAADLARLVVPEVLEQQRHVFGTAVAKRRQRDAQRAEPLVELGIKSSSATARDRSTPVAAITRTSRTRRAFRAPPGPRLIARRSLRCGPRPTCAISLTSSVPPSARSSSRVHRAAARRRRRDRRARSRGSCAARSRAAGARRARGRCRARPRSGPAILASAASVDLLAQLDHARLKRPATVRATREP